MVAGGPKAVPWSPAYECGSEVAILDNFDLAYSASVDCGYKFLPGYPVSENLKLPGSLFLPGYPVTGNLKLPGNLFLLGCLVFAWLHLPG